MHNYILQWEIFFISWCQFLSFYQIEAPLECIVVVVVCMVTQEQPEQESNCFNPRRGAERHSVLSRLIPKLCAGKLICHIHAGVGCLLSLLSKC